MPETQAPTGADEGRETWRRFVRADSYGLVLILILLVFMLPAIVPDDQPWHTIVAALACLSVLVSLHTSRVPVWLFWTAVALSVAAIGQSIIDLRDGIGVVSGSLGILLIAAPIAILNRLVRHRHDLFGVERERRDARHRHVDPDRQDAAPAAIVDDPAIDTGQDLFRVRLQQDFSRTPGRRVGHASLANNLFQTGIG